MNLFKIAFKVVRENSKEIFKGFGFKHLSDATQYYVHPDNQSYKGTTTLCQPIGEAVILFSDMLRAIMDGGKIFGDYWYDTNKDDFFLQIEIPLDFRENKVVPEDVWFYKAYLHGENLTVAAYDKNKNFIEGNVKDLSKLYKLLPSFCVLLARETERTNSYRDTLEKFIADSVPDTFVNLCEDFYQLHKIDNYNLSYAQIPLFEQIEKGQIDETRFTSFSSSYDIIKENKASLSKSLDIHVNKFSADNFLAEQLSCIPKLGPEFILPNKLQPLCNAIFAGDVLSVLFHGPAGTGKTMSCKLVCQEISLPIMETINCTENLDEFVLGKFIPDGDKIIFKESYVTKAIRDGGAVIFEEINFAKPQYMAFLNSLLDDNGFVRLDNGNVVHRHKNFRFFATMNLGYFGTKELNQALYNRFNAIIEVQNLSDDAIKRMLTCRVPECESVVEKIISVYHKLQKKIEAEELDIVLSPRNLENWVRLAKYEGYMTAAEKAVIPIAKGDRIFEQAIRGILMLYKWSEN